MDWNGGYLLGDTWFQVQESFWVGSIDTSQDWTFECDVQIGNNNDWFGSLIRFTATDGNWGTYGDEILNIDITSWNELFIASDTVWYPDVYEWTEPQPTATTLHLKIELSGSYRTVSVNGENVLYIDWMGERQSHQGVNVWVGDVFEWAADAMIKNVKWTNGGSTEIVVPNEGVNWGISWEGGELLGGDWYQVQYDNWVGSIDTSRDWIFEADVQLGDNNMWFGSLIRFTATTGNWGSYGDEILNIDITGWNEIFVASDTLDYPDIYEWTDVQPVGEVLHIKISLTGSTRQVWINGDSVLYLDWLGPRDDHQGVNVWAGDVFEIAADAKIKNVWWTNLEPEVVDDPPPWNSGEGMLLGDTWYTVTGGNFVGDIDTTQDFEFECEIEAGWDNWYFGTVIRFTITDGNWGTYGDEILNIDLTSWNEIFVASDTYDYPDIYEWLEPALEPGVSVHLRIRVEGSTREIWINGESVSYNDWLGARGDH